MITIEQIKAAESLIKNLMWLEMGNPLANHLELLRFGRKCSARIEQLYQQSGEYYENHVAPFKTLNAAMRYVIDCEIRAACDSVKPMRIPTEDARGTKRIRAMTKLGRGNIN